MSFVRRFSFSALLWLMSASVESLRGEEITRIKDVTALSAVEAGQNPRSVRLRGVVTEVGVAKTSITISDGADGIGIVLAAGVICPALGDAVEVDGQTTTFTVVGYSHPRVQASAVRVTGKGKLPEPAKLTLAEINSFKHFERWVSVEGHVMRWKFDPGSKELTFGIAGGSTWTTATVRTDGRPELLAQLMRAKVRVTGINAGITTHDANGALIAPSLAQLEMITPGSGSTFDAPLVTMREIKRGGFDPGVRVKVRGVVLVQRGYQVYLRGEDGAQLNALQSPWERAAESTAEFAGADPWPELKPGDVVEMVGSAGTTTNYPLIYGDVRVTGKEGRIPDPERVDIKTMKAGGNTDDWVSMEGRIAGWSLQDGHMLYAVYGVDDTVTLRVPVSPGTEFPKNLFGARARFTGVTLRLTGGTNFYTPGPSYVEILQPGTVDPFDVPECTAADIANNRVPPGLPVKLKGRIIGRPDAPQIYVRCADAALNAHLQLPWSRPANTTGMQFADSGPIPEMRIGDEVEIMGWPVRMDIYPQYAACDLHSTNVRVLGHQDKVEPVVTTFTRIAKGEHTSDLVQTRGRLLTIQVTPLSGGQWRTTMLLKSGGQRMTAVHQSSVLHPFDTLKANDDVLLQAVVDRATAKSPRQLRLLLPADAKSLGLSSDIIYLRLWMWGGGALAVLALFSGWIVALRKSNRIKTEVAAQLEQRVDERTAELSRAQAEISRALDQERELGELKSRFVTMVSHEFRTPLGIIMSAIELMRHYDDRLPQTKREELQQDIFGATRLMAGLMEQVLVLGRVEAGKLSCKTAPCDLDSLAAKLTDECLSATNRKCPVIWRAAGDLADAHADEGLLRHIFSNLIHNAVKYSPDDSTVEFTARRDANDAVFQVIDHGIGIPDADRARLFEAFHRGSNVGEIPGTGLGLVIVKRCVELHGASLEINSVVGKGTTFTVRLPLFGK